MTLGLATTAAAGERDDSLDLEARLLGTNEVPIADPDGRGEAEVDLRPEQDQVCFKIEFSRITTPNRAHIHRGVAGVNGPIVVAFLEPLTDPANPLHDQLERGRLRGCVTVMNDALLAEIAGNPAGFYVNLHNPRFPGGAIRGQLEQD